MSDLVAGAGIDLVHLGMGPDGHTASLFPGDTSLDAGPGVLVVTTEDPNGRNPHPRLTLTLPAINSARSAVFTVAGSSKAAAVAALGRAARTCRRPASTPGATTARLVDAAASGRSPPRLASMLSDADLLQTPLAELTGLARGRARRAPTGAG